MSTVHRATPVRRSARPRRDARASGLLPRIKEAFAARGIQKVKLGGFDVDGVFRGKYVSLDKFFSAAEGGLGFCDVVFGWDLADALYDNARVTGWHTGYPDALAKIDLGTFRVIPWESGTAAFLLDFVNPDGSPYEPSPRQLLLKVAADAEALGLRPKMSCEYEYYVFRETPQSLREKKFSGLTPLSPGMFGYSWIRSSANAGFVHSIVDGMKAFDVELEGMHTETGPGVYESAILYDDLPHAADKSALFKTGAKEICARQGLIPCFMAKYSEGLPGCSGHLHQSLWDLPGEKNLFFDEDRPFRMSEAMRHYLGGQLALMPELTALYWPTVNSYKRSVENTWAPTTATWGMENRTTAIRVIAGNASKSMRIEHRQPGADMNPYIAMAACLGAGLYGIRHGSEPPPPCEGNGYLEKRASPLPRSLAEAVRLLKGSEAAREILGEGFVDHYVRTREWEVRQFEKAVTSWELERYMEII